MFDKHTVSHMEATISMSICQTDLLGMRKYENMGHTPCGFTMEGPGSEWKLKWALHRRPEGRP